MISSTAAKYVRALAEVAAESDNSMEVKAGLEDFREIFHSHQGLREVLFNPTIPLLVKRNIVEEMARKMLLPGILVNFFFVILERSRLHLLDEFVDAYQEILDEEAGILRVEVSSSYPLTSGESERLREVMATLTGRSVKLSCEVDETLLGGVRLQVGSTVYDGTIRTQLAELRKQLSTASI